ncbi:DUF2599 domain-containing protein [Streptomyces sp. NPDC001093]|uniref:DUF2599 domain-containing protein n=1 Tax=Streptomyces sp. NPDC001093 TaxID=3154376 RepID=UPI00331D5304
MRVKTLSRPVAVAVALVMYAGGTALADGTPTDPPAAADTIAQQVNNVAPPADVVPPAEGKDGGTLTASGSDIKVTAPADNSGAVQVAPADSPGDTIGIGLPGSGSGDAAVASDGTITYQNAAPATDLAVQPLDQSVRLETVVRDGTAPTRYTYPVSLPAGATMAVQDDGSVLISGTDGTSLGAFAAPWAKDANGKDIPTRYEVQGDSLVQVIDHTTTADIAYPVVADPWLWRDLIHSASWTYHSGYGWTLKVQPTDWQRFWNGYAPAQAGWNELYAKYRNHGLDTNLGSMKNQYICHVLIVSWYSPNKATWDLDEWRPDVGLTDTINHKCNPGPGGFPGEW